MNTFFKSTVYAAFIGLTVLSSCEDEIKDFTVDPEETEQGDGNTTTEETKNLIINASINQTATGKTNWVVEDVIYVGSPSAAENAVTIDNQSSGFVKFTVSKIGEGAATASFEGEIPASLSGKKLLAFYGNAADMKVAASKVTLDLTSQAGTLMSAITDYTGEESINATFGVENVSAELKIKASGLSGVTEAVLSFNDASTIGFTNTKEFNAEGASTYATEKSMTVSISGGDNDEYTVSFMPSVSETAETMNIALKAAEKSGDYIYTKDLTNVSSSTSSYNIEIKDTDKDLELNSKLSGEGTETSPYIIDNVIKFNKINSNKHYQLSRDLDFTDIEFNTIAEFSGTIDGKEFTISNLSINPTNERCALIGNNTGTIRNLNINKVTVNAAPTAGAIAAENNGTIDNCHIDGGTVSGSGASVKVGGIVGNNKATISSSSVNNLNVVAGTSTDTNAGGFVGKSETTNCNITGSFAGSGCKISLITGTGTTNRVGGFVGSHWGGNIYGCYSKTRMNIEGQGDIGGFAGLIQSPTDKNIQVCYSLGTITNSQNWKTGGFVGNIFNSKGNIKSCYSLTTLPTTSDGTTNGFAGEKGGSNSPTIEQCYSDKDINNSIGEKVSIADLHSKVAGMNDKATNSGFEFVAGTTDDEPLIITKK